jgi:ribosomal protein L19
MKKITPVMVALSFVVSLAQAAEPDTKGNKEEMNVIKGPVVSLNIPQNQVVIKDSVTTYDRVFTVDPAVYSAIKLDDAVEAVFVTGSDKIKSIKVTKLAPVQRVKVIPIPAVAVTKETKPAKIPVAFPVR